MQNIVNTSVFHLCKQVARTEVAKKLSVKKFINYKNDFLSKTEIFS